MMRKNLAYRKRLRRSAAFVIAVLTGFFYPLLSCSFTAAAYTEKAGSINASTLNVRSGASTSADKVATLRGGTSVTVIDETTGNDGKKWYKVKFGNASDTGYVLSTYVKFNASYTKDENFEKMLTDEGFPDSYKDKLRLLHAEYPKWIFKAQHTGLDWETVIENEAVVGKNLVHTKSKSSWKSIEKGAYDWNTSSWPGFDTSAWVAANEVVIRHYMDPRNFLNSIYVFQFLNQRYDPQFQNISGLETLVKGTFMESRANNREILNAAQNVQGDSQNKESASSNPVTKTSSNSVSLTAPGDSSASSSAASSGVSPEAETSSSSAKRAQTEAPTAAETSSAAANQQVSAGQTPLSSGDGKVSLEAPSEAIKESESEEQNAGPGSSIRLAEDSTADNTGPGASQGGDTQGSQGGGQSLAPTDYTPLEGDKTYVDILLEAAVASGVNPYVLTSMIIQEQGLQGSSGLISGNTDPYKGIYNYYNVEAYQSGEMSPTQRGLWWASQNGSYNRPWNTRDKAIIGGAIFYGNNYVKSGQDTFYLKKFNVQGENLYKHQYMTYVEGAALEGARLSKAYSEELKNSPLVFKIPVFKNMPTSPAGLPEGDGNPNNKLSALSVEGYSITPTFNIDRESYDLIVPASVSSVTVNATAADTKATVKGAGTISLGEGGSDVTLEVKAENNTVRKYTIQIRKEGSGGSISSEGSKGATQDREISLNSPSEINNAGNKEQPNRTSDTEGAKSENSGPGQNKENAGQSSDIKKVQLISPGGN